MVAPGAHLVVDGHRSYPALASAQNKYTVDSAPGTLRGPRSKSIIEGLWGELKIAHEHIYHSKMFNPNHVMQECAEAAWRIEHKHDECRLRDSLILILKTCEPLQEDRETILFC